MSHLAEGPVITRLFNIVLLFAATLLRACTAHAQVDEILVEAKFPCGPWPIEHVQSMSCHYPRIERDAFDAVMALREALHKACLDCDKESLSCRKRNFSRSDKQDARVCKSVFLTPRRIPNLVVAVGLSRAVIDVDVTFNVSPDGLVEAIKVTDVDGARHVAGQRLVTRAARNVRFEPLIIDGQAYQLEGLEGAYRFD